MSGFGSSSTHDIWSGIQPPSVDDAMEYNTASTPQYRHASHGTSGGFPPQLHRTSDPQPLRGAFFSDHPFSGASSEPSPEILGSPCRNAPKDKGWYFERSHREFQELQNRLERSRRQVDHFRQKEKTWKDVADSRGVELFRYLRKAKEFDNAKKLYQEIVDSSESNKSEDEGILGLQYSFAAMLMEQKRFEEAEPISRAVLEKRMGTPNLPSESLSEIAKESHRQLCSILCAMGRHRDAEKMHRSMYQSETMDLWALENGDEVCQRLREQGQFLRAKDLQEDVWLERQKRYSPRDGLTVRSGLRFVEDLKKLVANLDNRGDTDAVRRRNRGDRESCESQIEITLSKIWDTREYPEPSTDILTAGHNLGAVILLQEKFPDAEAILRPVWEGKRAKFGERDINTISTGRLFGRALCRQEKEETYREAVGVLQAIWQPVTNNWDAESLPCAEDLAQAYRSLRQLPHAEQVYRWILQQKAQKPGISTQEIDNARWNLGQVLYTQRDIKSRDAVIVLRDLYQSLKVSSPNSDRTLQCGHMLAQSIWTHDGKPEKALNIALDVFKERGASAERGVAYLESAHLYSSMLLEVLKFADAEKELKSVWGYQAEGAEEQNLRSKCGHLYGQALSRGQKYRDAKKVLEIVLQDQETNSAGLHEIAEARRLLDEVNQTLEKKKRKSIPRRKVLTWK